MLLDELTTRRLETMYEQLLAGLDDATLLVVASVPDGQNPFMWKEIAWRNLHIQHPPDWRPEQTLPEDHYAL